MEAKTSNTNYPQAMKGCPTRKNQTEGLQERLKLFGVALNKKYTGEDLPLAGMEVLAEGGLRSYFLHRIQGHKVRMRQQSMYKNPYCLYVAHEHYLPEIPQKPLYTRGPAGQKSETKVSGSRVGFETFDPKKDLLPLLKRKVKGTWEDLEGRSHQSEQKMGTIQKFVDIKKNIAFSKVLSQQRRDNLVSLQSQIHEEVIRMSKEELKFIMDSRKFEEYLEALASAADVAVGIAVEETKKRLSKDKEIEKLVKKSQQLRQSVIKLDETLKRYKVYQKYVLSAEQDFLGNQDLSLSNEEEVFFEKEAVRSRQESSDFARPRLSTGDPFIDKYLAMEETDVAILPFKTPQEYLDVLSMIESQSLTVFQNSQEMNEDIESLRKDTIESLQKLESEVKSINEKMKDLEEAIMWKETMMEDVRVTLKTFVGAENTFLERDIFFETLDERLQRIYESTLGHPEGDISGVQMLREVEEKFVDLVIEISDRPSHVIRAKVRELKFQDQREATLQREMQVKLDEAAFLAKTVARTLIPPPQKRGRKLFTRSAVVDPVPRKPRVKATKDKRTVDKEFAYFFT